MIPSYNDILSILPALILCAGGLLLLVVQFLLHDKNHVIIRAIAGGTFLVALGAVVISPDVPGKGFYFNGQVAINYITFWLNFIYILTAFLTILASPSVLKQHGITFPEFYPLMLFATTGMLFMTSANDLILIFVGLELLSIALYVMIGMARNEVTALEATMKYFLLGSFSSGFMLMGIAFLYGGSGSTLLPTAIGAVAKVSEIAFYSKIGFALLLVGVFFKIALVPFHSWTPDVYEGSLTPITGFMASGAKAAAMGLLLVLFKNLPFQANTEMWLYLLGTISVVSMTVGNIFALRQDSLKRVLAYSSISHAGVVVAGIAAGADREALYYLMMYSFMNLAGFGIIAHLENGKLQVTYNTLKYLVSTKPMSAFGLLVVFFSLGGIPPLAGFWTKLFIFQKLATSNHPMLRFMLIAGVINSAIAIYYYLRVTVNVFMNEEKGDIAIVPELDKSYGLSFVSGLSIAAILLLWIVFTPNSMVF